MEDKKKPGVWITLLKLVLGAAVVLGGVGLALWYAAQVQRLDDPNKAPDTPAKSWGIVHDSPVRPRL